MNRDHTCSGSTCVGRPASCSSDLDDRPRDPPAAWQPSTATSRSSNPSLTELVDDLSRGTDQGLERIDGVERDHPRTSVRCVACVVLAPRGERQQIMMARARAPRASVGAPASAIPASERVLHLVPDRLRRTRAMLRRRLDRRPQQRSHASRRATAARCRRLARRGCQRIGRPDDPVTGLDAALPVLHLALELRESGLRSAVREAREDAEQAGEMVVVDEIDGERRVPCAGAPERVASGS